MNKFIKSTIILIIGGFITKILGMFIRIIITRYLKTEGIGIYMLISPTLMLMISLSSLGLPVAISSLVSKNTYNNKKLVLGIIPISILINILLMFILLLLSPFISNVLLKESRTLLGIKAIAFILPFISVSSIIRGYYFGRQKMIPHVITNIIEDLIRMILIIIFLPKFIAKGIEYAIFFLVITNIFSELSTIIILTLLLPNKKIKKEYLIPDKKNIKDILNIGLPTTGSRIIGSIGSFLEPIIITFVLLKIGYDNHFIISEYGIINGYVLPILTLPSFFTMAISQALIPIISESYARKKIKNIKYKLWQAIAISLAIGISFTIVLELFPKFILNLIYNTDKGINYIRILSPIFIFSYIQTPLTSAMQAMDMSKQAMKATLLGTIIRTILLFVLSFFKIGLNGLLIALCINIIYVTIHHIIYIKKALNRFNF